MKLKLDENLGRRGAELLRSAGHDVSTVADQELFGAKDQQLIAVCATELRALVTLDLDFANPLVFDPTRFSGIAVLRLPRKATLEHLHGLTHMLIRALEIGLLDGKLWIVEAKGIREYQPGGG